MQTAARQETVIIEDGFQTSIPKGGVCRAIITTTTWQALHLHGIWVESYIRMSMAKARRVHTYRLKLWNP